MPDGDTGLYCTLCGQAAKPRYYPFCGRDCSDRDLNRVCDELALGIESLAIDLLGEPSSRTSRSWRWGAKGSLAVEIAGPKRGAWFCHEAGIGGGPLKLIRHARSCSMAAAIAWARAWCGGAATTKPSGGKAKDTEQTRRDVDAADAANRTAAARHMWDTSTGPGQLVDAYLTTTRSIPRPAGGWPNAVRFHQPTSALILAAVAKDGALRAVHRVRLTLTGQKAPATPEQPTKITNGVLAGAAVRLPGDQAGPLLLAEGPETGLSVWVATGYETWITLGTAPLTPPLGRRTVVCRDDDMQHSPADKKMTKMVHEWRTAGHQVVVATPWSVARHDKSDFNDVIQHGGVAAVRDRIEAALFPPSPDPDRRLPVAQARRQLDAAVGDFFAKAAAYDCQGDVAPPVHAIRVDVGTGKSAAAREHVARAIIAMRAAGDTRSIALLVPTHTLGEEQASAFEALAVAQEHGLKAAIWRGRAAPDPDAPGEPMCRDLDAVRDAQSAGANVQTAVCRKKLPGGEVIACPYFDTCGYQAQHRRKADLWIGPHEILFDERPSTFGELAAIIVDESAWQDGLEGASEPPIMLALDTLDADDAVPGEPLNGQRLMFLRRLALYALRDIPDGPVLRKPMLLADITPENAAEAARLEWMRKVDPEIRPGMARTARKAAVETAQGNRTIIRLAMFWRALAALTVAEGPAASGWAELAQQEGELGTTRVLRLKERKPIRAGWQVPTLLIDATLNIDLVRPFWPNVVLTADIAVATPYQKVWQVANASFPRNRFIASPMADDATEQTCAKKLRELHAILAHIARCSTPGRVLVVVQKAVEDALLTLAPLPGNIELAHHNAVAGRDGWKDITALIVVGRTAPPPAAVNRIAEALTGAAVSPLPGWYEKATTMREMAGADPIEAMADRHPNPVAEAIRWAICEGELVQIIGRGRGVNRTETNPLDVLIMTSVPLPIPVDETLLIGDLAPSPQDLMLAAGGISFTSGAEAYAAYPDLFPSIRAAQKALERSPPDSLSPKSATFPYNSIPIGECRKPRRESGCPPYLRRVDFQVLGAGRKATFAWFDSQLVLDIQTALVRLIGGLRWCKVVQDPSDAKNPLQSPRPSARYSDDAAVWSQ